LLVTLAKGERLRRLDKTLGAIGIFLDVHIGPFQPAPKASAEHDQHPFPKCGATQRQNKSEDWRDRARAFTGGPSHQGSVRRRSEKRLDEARADKRAERPSAAHARRTKGGSRSPSGAGKAESEGVSSVAFVGSPREHDHLGVERCAIV